MSELDRADVREQVRLGTDIVSVIGDYVALKRSGGNHKGICPFHGEKTPSFSVSAEKRLFYCFGCHESGDVFDFLMKVEGITFRDALEQLAERAGIELPSAGIHDTEVSRARKVAFSAYNTAAKLYHGALVGAGAEQARQYLIDRGITSEDVLLFGLGYAPNDWTALVDALSSRGMDKPVLVEIGLASHSQANDSYFDRIRNRVIFPISDDRKRVVGFGARSIDGTQPKYINSSDSVIFSKGKCLYGIRQARDAIRSDSKAVLVEGYMDVIACHRVGVRSAVASLGTALTSEQARMIGRMAKDVILCYDGDSAGIAATTKAYQTLAAEGLRVRVARMDKAKDPDELVRAQGADALRAVLDSASSVIDWRLSTLAGELDLGDPEGRIEAVRRIVPLLAGMTNAVERSEYVRLVASRLQAPLGAVEEEVRKARLSEPARAEHVDTSAEARDTRTNNAKQSALSGGNAGLPSAVVSAERELIGLMMDSVDMMEVIRKSLGADAFRVELHREVVSALFEACSAAGGNKVDREGFRASLGSDEGKALVSRLAMRSRPGVDRERIFLDCANKVREYQLLEEMGRLGHEAEDHDAAGRADEAKECLRRLKFLRERLEREFRSPQV